MKAEENGKSRTVAQGIFTQSGNGEQFTGAGTVQLNPSEQFSLIVNGSYSDGPANQFTEGYLRTDVVCNESFTLTGILGFSDKPAIGDNPPEHATYGSTGVKYKSGANTYGLKYTYTELESYQKQGFEFEYKKSGDKVSPYEIKVTLGADDYQASNKRDEFTFSARVKAKYMFEIEEASCPIASVTPYIDAQYDFDDRYDVVLGVAIAPRSKDYWISAYGKVIVENGIVDSSQSMVGIQLNFGGDVTDIDTLPK